MIVIQWKHGRTLVCLSVVAHIADGVSWCPLINYLTIKHWKWWWTLEAGVYIVNLVIGLAIDRSHRLVPHYNRLVVLPVTALFMLGQYWYISRDVLRPASVKTDTPTVADLETRVTRLAAQASIHPPSVAIITSSVPNCYTVGRQGNATIVVSTALLETLDDAELDAVLAHELAHVLNRDVTVMTLAVAPFRFARTLVTTLDWGLTVLGTIAYGTLYLGTIGVTIVIAILGVLSWVESAYNWLATVAPVIDPGPIIGIDIITGIVDVFFDGFVDYIAGVAATLLTGGLFLLPVVLALSVYYVILGVIPRRFTIYREYAADRGAALLTGEPTAVANALRTLATDPNRPTADLRHATDIQALCLLPDGITDESTVGPIRDWIADDWPMFDAGLERISAGIVAHPPVDERIARLRQIDQALEAL